MDLGYPQTWAPKDVVVIIGILFSVAFTVIALWCQARADRHAQIAEMPRIARLREDDTSRQERFAEEAAVRRAAAERARLNRRIGNGYFVLAVVASDITAAPWLMPSAVFLAAAMGIYYFRERRSVIGAIEQRLGLLDTIRKIHQYSISTPFMTDEVIQSEVEGVFATPDEKLADLQQTYTLGLIEQRKKHKAYLASRSR